MYSGDSGGVLHRDELVVQMLRRVDVRDPGHCRRVLRPGGGGFTVANCAAWPGSAASSRNRQFLHAGLSPRHGAPVRWVRRVMKPQANSRAIRIVHVSLQLDTGGMEKLLVEFARHVDRARFELRFVSLSTR